MNDASAAHHLDAPYVIGTAGHVDHGKSTLVKALTGVDPDRLAEEREREMTIDLGFAALTLPDGRVVSIVDVPGHERFVSNMLAGAGGIDLAMLVIAADDGPMPQTREHLAILDLLGVDRGVVVVSRSDLVDAEWRDLVIEEARGLIDGTALAGSPVIAVSAVTGEGLDDLRAVLAAELNRATARDAGGAMRLPVDRAFHVAGFGTVVTGTLIGGEVGTGDELTLYPDRRSVRVRGLQAHGRQVDAARAGNRVALNLGGIDRAEVHRGHVIATPGSLTPSLRFDIHARLLASAPTAIEQNDELIVFIGAAEVPARVTLLDRDRLEPGGEGWLQLRLAHPSTAQRGDRLILRRPSPATTVGGGVVVDSAPPRHRRMRPDVIRGLEVLEQGTPEELVTRAIGDGVMDVAALARASGVPDAERVIAAMVERGDLVALGDGAMSPRMPVMAAIVFARLKTRSAEFLSRYHAAHPLDAGARRDELGVALGIRSQRAVDELVHALVSEGEMRALGGRVMLPDFSIELPPADRARADAFLAAARAEPHAPPSPTDFGIDERLLQALAALGEVARVSDQIAYPSDVFAAIKATVMEMLESEGSITLAGYRDRFGTSRKFAQPTLEYLDELRVTRRKGDIRIRYRGPGAAS